MREQTTSGHDDVFEPNRGSELQAQVDTSGSRVPDASAIIPAHNEEASIAATLSALLAETEAGEFDIVVVCNGCSDATAALAWDFPGGWGGRTPRAIEDRGPPRG